MYLSVPKLQIHSLTATIPQRWSLGTRTPSRNEIRIHLAPPEVFPIVYAAPAKTFRDYLYFPALRGRDVEIGRWDGGNVYVD